MSVVGERVLTWPVAIVISISAIAVAGAAVHREFFTSPVNVSGSVARQSEYMANWRTLLPVSRRLGSSAAPVTIVELTDLECPFCREFNRTVHKVLNRYPERVAYAFVHRPLAMHRHATAAARAAECAASFGRFAEAVDALFENQDSLGIRSWGAYARQAGVGDTAGFRRCMADTETAGRNSLVDAGAHLADSLGIHATPTIILNGWRYAYVPSDTELFRAIDDLLAGRPPYHGFPASGTKTE